MFENNILNNGYVILEKYYNNSKTKSLAYNEAIYIFKTSEFEELCKHSKLNLISNKKCIRLYHVKNWEKHIKKYIDKASNMKDIYDAEILKNKALKNSEEKPKIKKLKKTNKF